MTLFHVGQITVIRATARQQVPLTAMGLLLGVLFLVLPARVMAANVNATWNGGASNWNNISNWSGAVVPNNGGGNTFSVLIDGGKGTNSVAMLDISAAINNLTIDNGDQLGLNNGTSLAIGPGTVTDNGTLQINSSGATTTLGCFGGTVLSGTGNIQMSNNANNRIIADDTVCVQTAGHTIHGAGQVLANTGGMQSAGSIVADQATPLTIDPNAHHFINTGTLRAQAGGTLRLVSDTFTNTGGLIQALDASAVSVESAAVVGGTVATMDSGIISVDNGSFTDVTNNGAVVTFNGRTGSIFGTWTDNGTWSLNSSGATTNLGCIGGAMLAGPGTLVMSNNANNRIITDDTVCLHAGGHTIRGAGQVLANTGGMQNAGTISADQPTPLAIDPNGHHFANTGTLQAQGGGTLRLVTDTFTNAGGLIQALDASAVSVESASIVGGTIATLGTGVISVDGGAFTDVTSNAAVVTANGRSGTVAGTLANNGTWALNSSGATTDLACAGGALLSGPGSIIMSNNINNRIITDDSVCKHAASHTIHGAGQVLANTGGLQNDGTIIADQSSGLIIDPNQRGVTNTGKLRATNGATLRLAAGTFTNTNGLIEALDASSVAVSNSAVVEGTVTTSGSGAVSVEGSTFTNVLNTGMAVTVNGQSGSITGTLTNNGVWSLGSTGATTNLGCIDSATIAGGGSIVMSDNVNNRIITNDTVCTHAAGHTIHGAGQVLADSGGMINNGMISADLSTPLIIDPNNRGFTNNALLRAAGGGTLRLVSGGFDNGSGVISAGAGSQVSIESAGVTGGHIISQGSGSVSLDSATLGSLSTTAAIQEFNGRSARITGTIVNDGIWSLLSSGATTDLVCADNATLTGMGSIVMSNNINNRIVTNDTICMHTSQHTISGGGQILANSGGMVNAGTIIANQSSPLAIDPNGRGFTNTGTLRADGGTLVLQSGDFMNANGLIQALNLSAVQINAATVANGTISSSGNGTVFAQGGSLFTNVTSTASVTEVNGTSASVTGTLVNNGTWSVGSTGATTDFNCLNNATLSGSGSIVMSNNGNNRIVTNDTVCKNASGHTIRGAGQLLANSGGMVNQGIIVADQATPLAIDANGKGFANEGTVHAVGAGGIVSVPDAFTNAGTVIVDPGSAFSRTGAYTQTDGTTTVNGTLSATGLVDIQAGVLEGTGTVAATVSNAGAVNPGTGTTPGLLTVNGTYTQLAGGTFNIEIGGPTVGTDYDRLAVTGMVTLAGTINISLAHGFKPAVGSKFTIMTLASRAGDFATYNGLTQPNGVIFTAEYTPSSLVLTVVGEGPTATVTQTLTPSATPTRTPTVVTTATGTATPSPSASLTRTPTLTTTPNATTTATKTATQTVSPTPTTTRTASPTGTQTLTPTPSPTPTLAVTPGMVALFGRVLSPGLGGFPGSHGQVPIGDARVDLFLCPLRTPCLGTGDPVTHVFTQPDGRFVILVEATLLENKLPVVVARLTPTVAFRAPVIVLRANSATRAARQVSGTGAIVDAISEAAVRLLEDAGFENFTVDGIAAVLQAVETANTDSNFELLTPEQAADAATGTAAADPNVQMTLEDNTLPTPTPTSTPPTSACVGDCSSNGEVTVDEVIKGVNIALDNAALDTCPKFDVDGNGEVTINELILAVNNVLNGCQ